MHNTPRLIKWLIVAMSFLAHSQLGAQRTPVRGEEEPIPQNIEAVLLEERNLGTELFYLDYNGEYKPFKMINGGRGGMNTQVLSDHFVLNTKSYDEEGNIVWTPAMDMKIPKTERVLLLFYGKKDGSMTYSAYPDSADIHPGGTGRIINLTNERAVCLLGDKKLILQPGQTIISENLRDAGDRFKFGFAIDTEERARRDATVQRLRLRNDSVRFLAVLAYSNYNFASGADIEEQIGRITVSYTLYDRVRQAQPDMQAQASGVQ